MPAHVLIVDALGVVLAVVGFLMAFRQGFVRNLFGLDGNRVAGPPPADAEPDPLTYVLRISGVMIMVFGIALGLMVTLYQIV